MLLEEEIRGKIRERLVRGKIDVNVTFTDTRMLDASILPNFELLDKYDRAFREIEARYGLAKERTLTQYVTIHDAILIRTDENAHLDEYTDALRAVFEAALDQLDQMRSKEGQKLAEDIAEKLASILGEIVELERLSKEFPVSYASILRSRIRDLLSSSKYPIDERILANEVAVFAERTDVQEEIVRLRTHVEQMKHWLQTASPIGRKLDFLAQEMLREANTIGSKFPDIKASGHVIQVKSLIDQIKEQIQNIL